MTKTGRVGRPRISPQAADGDPRELILQAAAALFSQKGISGTSMTEIANRAGLRGPSLYHYFDSKDAIVEVLADFTTADSLTFLMRTAAESRPAAERLYLVLRQHVERLVSAPYDLSFLLEPPELRQAAKWARPYRRWADGIERLVREGIETGEFVPGDPGMAVVAITGLIEAILSTVHGRRKQISVTAGDYVARFALRALLTNTDALEHLAKRLDT